MTNEELRALNKTRQIQQIAFLTRDLEKSMQAWIDVLRIGPWRVFRFTDETVKNLEVGGKPVDEPFEFRIAITHVGGMELELIQPVRGPMIYQEHLERRGEGLHHIKEKLPDDTMRAIVADYEKRGVPVTQTGQFVADFHFYLDTEPRTRLRLRARQLPLSGSAAGDGVDLPAGARLTAAPRRPTASAEVLVCRRSATRAARAPATRAFDNSRISRRPTPRARPPRSCSRDRPCLRCAPRASSRGRSCCAAA